MSFKAELETLIANANSSLEDLEGVLRRAQSPSGKSDNTTEASNGDVGEIQAQLDAVRQRLLSSLLEIRESYNHDQERLSDLEGELKLDLENVRQCAIDYFIKGGYSECERLLSFLAKIQPDDENLKSFLELSRRKQLENEQVASFATDTQSQSKGGDSEQQLSRKTGDQPIDEIPGRTASGNGLEALLGSAGETALPSSAAAGEPDGSPYAFRPDPLAPPETIDPQILAEIELKTAAHIDETYRIPPNSGRPWFLVSITAGLLIAITLWLFKFRPESAVPESQSASRSTVEELVLPANPLENLRQEAQALFDAGKLQEAGLVCDAILSKAPQDGFAVGLKDTIRATLVEPNTQMEETAPSEQTAQLHQTPTGQSAGVPSAALQLQSQPLLSEASSQRALSTNRAALKPIDATAQKPGSQRQRFAPTKPSATATASVAPTVVTTPGQVATAPQIRPEQLLELNSRIQAKDFDQARLLLERLESEFPGNPDLRALSEQLRVEAGKQRSLALSWIEKAEVAKISGRYVTPPGDNVVVYCNFALKADPKNQRAANLKREIVQRAVAEATDWIQRGKFDAARLFYASMDYLAIGDDAFPYTRPVLKRELEKLGFKTYSMIHDHRLGSCSGVLKFNAYAVAYVPSGDSVDGFSESLNSIVMNAEGERLRISYRDRTFRFRSENGEAVVQAIYQQLMTRMTDERSILAGRTKETRQP